MITLRPAAQRDARAIRQLIWRVGINPFGLNWQRFMIAVDDQDRLVGCGQIKPHGDGTCEMASIAVQPEWQGRGIGRAIIERLLAENSLPLYLTCQSKMVPYYQRFGFQTLAPEKMPPYFHRLYIMVLLIRRFSPGMGEMQVMIKAA